MQKNFEMNSRNEDESLHRTDLFAGRRLWVKRVFGYGVGWPLITYFMLALFMPDDVLKKLPMLKVFAIGVADVVTSVYPELNFLNHSLSTSFPQVALLCDALAMILIPWLIFAASMGMLMGYSYGRVESNPFIGMSFVQLLVIAFIVFLGIPIGIWIVHIFYAIPGDPQIYAGITTKSRLGYACLSTGVIMFSAGCIWMQPLYVVVLVDKFFFGGFENA